MFSTASNPLHEGESSGRSPYGNQVFVSTNGTDAHGDVFLTNSQTGERRPLTCGNTDTETHPVLSEGDHLVAYASNHGGDGHFHIWVARLDAGSGATAAPSSSATGSTPCVDVQRTQITFGPGDDLWPSFASFRGGGDPIVFSSTRDNPLGDLYVTSVPAPATDPSSTTSPPTDAFRLTDGHGTEANTQPAVGDPWVFRDEQRDEAVLFTTTRFRPDGSLGEFVLPTDLATVPTVVNAFSDPVIPVTVATAAGQTLPPPQSSEAAWSLPDNTHNTTVLYTSTQDDPYGDVRRIGTTDEGLLDPPATSTSVAAAAGVAESHGAFLTTPRQDGTAQVAVTARNANADVSDVVATDGSGRRTVAAFTDSSAPMPLPLDERAPAYSPDGTRIAYSRQQPNDSGRVIVVANADGSNAVAHTFGRRTDGRAGDADFDPVWSPDGTRIAFQRLPSTIDSGFASGIWVADVATGAAHRVSVTPPSDRSYADSSPSWSPDGTRLVVSRRIQRFPVDVGVGFTGTESYLGLPVGAKRDLAVTVRSDGSLTARGVVLHLDFSGTGLLLDRQPLPAGCTVQGEGSTCAVGELANGEHRDLTFHFSADHGGMGVIQAAVTTDSHDSNPQNDTANPPISVRVDDQGPSPTAEPVPPVPSGGVPLAANNVGQLWVLDPTTAAEGAPVTPPAGCQATLCTADAVAGRSPAWSPDGRQIAYQQRGDVWLLDLATAGGKPSHPERATRIMPLTGMGLPNASGGYQPTPSRPVLSTADQPAWSPKGAEIAVDAQPAGQPDQRGIYALRPDGTQVRAVAQQRGPETDPAWQPYADLAVTLKAVPSALTIGAVTTLTATVSNVGPARAATPVLSLTLSTGLAVATPTGCTLPAANILRCMLPTLAPGAVQAITTTATGQAPRGVRSVSAAVTSMTPDPVLANNTATTQVQVAAVRTPGQGADLAVTLVLSRNPAYVGGTVVATVRVTNNGPQPAVASTLTMGYPAGVTATGIPGCLDGSAACPLGTLAPGATSVLTPTLTARAKGAGAVLAKVAAVSPDPLLLNNTAGAPLSVVQPALRLLPPIGPPGFVPLAYGEGFPPGANLTLTWQAGITTDRRPVRVAADGTVRAPVLVIRRDALGLRDLVATSVDATMQFAPVKAPMLVVARSVSPPRFLGRG